MIALRKDYYFQMLQKGRLMPFFDGKRMVAFITFYITNNMRRYVEADPWAVLDDDCHGDVCYISQMLTTRNKDDGRLNFQVWHRFKEYIKKNFGNVKSIHWRRWDKERSIVKEYKKEL